MNRQSHSRFSASCGVSIYKQYTYCRSWRREDEYGIL